MKVSKASAYGLHALMYMVRHVTQLPATAETVAKAEGIPAQYLAKILQGLTRAGFIKLGQGRKNGYVFARPPEEVTLLQVLETLEGQSLFGDCPLRHCECGGTPENCCLFAQWVSVSRNIKKLFEETSIVTAAWNHPEHRFGVPPKRADTRNFRIETLLPGSQIRHEESSIPS